jgi:hypothetical protein
VRIGKLAIAKCLKSVSVMGIEGTRTADLSHIGIRDPLSRQQALRSNHDTSCFVEVGACKHQLMSTFSRLLLPQVCEERNSK